VNTKKHLGTLGMTGVSNSDLIHIAASIKTSSFIELIMALTINHYLLDYIVVFIVSVVIVFSTILLFYYIVIIVFVVLVFSVIFFSAKLCVAFSMSSQILLNVKTIKPSAPAILFNKLL
jgi:hypothetical protein